VTAVTHWFSLVYVIVTRETDWVAYVMQWMVDS